MLAELSVSVFIVSVCLLIHIAVMGRIAERLLSRRERILTRTGVTRDFLLLLIVFSVILLLHVTETGIWALFYYSRTLFNDFETSLYFSMGSYTTIGYGDVVLPHKWRLLGAIEGISGVLLCGISTAFIFAVVNMLFQVRLQQKASE